MLTWLILILTVGGAYSFKDVLLHSRVIAYLLPGYGYKNKNNSITFRKSNNGQFYIITKINNKYIRCLLDTGASDVILSRQDAVRVGINTKDLVFDRRYNTANGAIYAASTIVEQLAISDLVIHNVRVSVSGSALKQSLLGMSVLKNFRFVIDDDSLTIFYH